MSNEALIIATIILIIAAPQLCKIIRLACTEKEC